MAVQSRVFLVGVQCLVVVMICSSVLMPTQTNFHTLTLVTHTALLVDMNLALHKPELCWREATNLRQLRLKYFALNKAQI